MATVASGVICMWPSTAASIPANWTRATAYDARFVKMIATSATAPGTTGGASSHVHTLAHTHTTTAHTHTSGDLPATGATATATAAGGYGTAITTHTHTLSLSSGGGAATGAESAAAASTSTEPPFYEVIFIKSDGTPTGFPNGALAYFNAAAPTGWAAHAASLNRVMKGAAAAGNGGGTGGTGDAHTHTTDHTHSAASHTHTLSVGNNSGATDAGTTGGATSIAGSPHAHSGTSGSGGGATDSVSASIANGDITPPWIKQLVIENTSGAASFPKNIIAIWDGAIASIPASWVICDGNNSTPNLSNEKYVRGTNVSGDVGTTGGATTHTHTSSGHTHADPSHDHSATTGGATVSDTLTGSANLLTDGGHTHTVTSGTSGPVTTGSTSPTTGTGANDPLFTGVAYIMYTGAPAAPTITVPLAATTYNGTVVVAASSVDPDSENVRIIFEYDRNDSVWVAIGTSAFVASGASATYSWNTDPLTNATNYRVRARAEDTAGIFSGYTTTSTFTINYLPTVTTLNTPVSGSSYSTTIALSATLADTDADTVTAEFEYSSNSGGAWTSIGDGTTVASGSASTRTWDISAFTPGINYRVRVRARDTLSGLSGYTSTIDFLIGPSLSALFADKNTAQYFVTKNTAQYFAEKN